MAPPDLPSEEKGNMGGAGDNEDTVRNKERREQE